MNAEMEEFINRVREGSDIYAVVSRYVTLNFNGGRYWACCPFHNEKTPSFTITPDKGMFYCFGCHAGGNVFKFISMIENISYFEAVKLQAERLGIELPSRNKTPEEIQLENKRKILLKITSLAQEFYHNCLTKKTDGEIGRKYLASRGITSGVIEQFNLGYAPNSWDSLTKTLKNRGFDDRQLVAAGVAIENKSGAGVYDRLRNRVIIPIADIHGNVVAFGGRTLSSDDNEPKYLNTPETEIFSKGKLLFGLDKANRSINASNSAIIVEGYMDAISLASAGVENVVASLGTAFTAEHAKLLTRYARRISFCYDSDDAGQRATMRALPIMQKTGAEIFIAVVPDGKDPDEFVRKHGKDAFDNLIKNALPMIEYKIQYIIKGIDTSTTSGISRAVQELLPILAEINDVVILNKYVKKIATALELNSDIIRAELDKFNDAQPNYADPELPKTQSNTLIQRAGRDIIRMAWYSNDILEYVFDRFPKELLTETHREIVSYLEKCYSEGIPPNDLGAADSLSEKANAEVSLILIDMTAGLTTEHFKAFDDSIQSMRWVWLKSRYKEMRIAAEMYLKSGDELAYAEKMRESLGIQQEMEELIN